MLRVLLLLLTPLVLTACVEENRYPVTNEECTADDPVLELDASDCAALPAAGGGF